jgi:hypothetical protein
MADSIDITERQTKALEDVAKAVSDVASGMKGGADSMASFKRQVIEANAKLAELTKDGKECTNAFKEAEAQLRKGQEAWKAQYEAMKKTEEQFKKIEKECENTADSYAKLINVSKLAFSETSKLIGALGLGSISFGKAKESLLGFNNAMFSSSRSYQMLGKGLGDLNKVFEGVSKNTTYSKREFSELANSIISSWKGVPPTFTEFGKILEVVGVQFGHNKEQIKSYLSSVAEIQSILPSAAKAIKDSIVAMNDKSEGWEQRINGSKILAANLYAAGKITQASYLAQMQALTPLTAAQKEQNKLTEAQGKAAAAMENAMVSAMQSIQKPVTYLLSTIAAISNGLEKLPALVMTVVAAFALMKLPVMASNMGLNASMFSRGGGGLKNINLGVGGGAGLAMRGIGGGVLGGVMGGFQGYESKKRESLDAGESEEIAKSKGIRGAVSGSIGSGVGSALGAAIGSVIAPGIGTAIGTIAGGYLGTKFLTPLLGKIMGADTKPKTEEELKQEQATKAKKDMEQYDKDNPMEKQVISVREMVTNNRYLIEANSKLKDQYQAEADLLKESSNFSGMNIALYNAMNQTKELQESTQALIESLTSAGSINLFEETLKSLGSGLSEKIKEQLKSGDYKEALTGIQKDLLSAANIKKVQIIKEAETDPSKRATLTSDLATVDASVALNNDRITEGLKAQVDLLKSQVDLASTVSRSYNDQADKLSTLNDVYSRRLDMERSVQEAAQFGMGASITMMQKQISMAYDYIGIEKNRLGLMDQNVIAGLKLANIDEQSAIASTEELKNAKSSSEANAIIERYAKGNSSATKQLTDYSQQYQNSNAKILEQQKKVYDLTKDIREGYLDAIREMTAGAGEFESIIGTQDMGVTQLMDKVDMFTPGALNTMRTGGRQSRAETEAGVGMDITGAYSSGGPTLSFIDKKRQDERNARIYGYAKSEEEAKAMSKGEGRQATAGSALSAGEDGKYLRSIQEEKDIQVDAIKTAYREMGLDRLPGTITGGAGTYGTFGNYERNNTGLALPTAVAFGARASAPADPSPLVRGAMGGNMGGNNMFINNQVSTKNRAPTEFYKTTDSYKKYGIPTRLTDGSLTETNVTGSNLGRANLGKANETSVQNSSNLYKYIQENSNPYSNHNDFTLPIGFIGPRISGDTKNTQTKGEKIRIGVNGEKFVDRPKMWQKEFWSPKDGGGIGSSDPLINAVTLTGNSNTKGEKIRIGVNGEKFVDRPKMWQKEFWSPKDGGGIGSSDPLINLLSGRSDTQNAKMKDEKIKDAKMIADIMGSVAQKKQEKVAEKAAEKVAEKVAEKAAEKVAVSGEHENELGQFDSKEMGAFASSMSQGLGDITRKKTESEELFTKRRTKMLSQQYVQSKPWENFARKTDETDEDFEKRIGSEQKKMSQTQEAIQMAGKMRYDKKGASKEKGQEVVMETVGGKGFTSADAKKGIALPSEDASASMYMDAGGGGSSSGGGGVGGVITVELSAELKGTINEMHGILVKLNNMPKLP